MSPDLPGDPGSGLASRALPGYIAEAHVRNIATDIILTLVTCGLFNAVVQNSQMKTLNALLNQKKYSFWSWALLTLVTFGLYHIYHEYRMAEDMSAVSTKPNPNDSLLAVLLTVFGMSIVADAIRQSQINKLYGNSGL